MTDIRYDVVLDTTGIEAGSRRGVRSFRELGGAARTAERDTGRLTRSFKTLNTGIASSIDSVFSLRGALGGLTVGLVLREMVQTVAGFQSQMAGVGVVTSATAEEMRLLTNMARDLGATTIFSAKEAASGMEFLGRAGFEVGQIMSALPGTLDLAAATALDLGRAADVASNVLTSFNLEAVEMGRVADVLATATASANTDINQLADALKFAAPVAAGFGVSMEEATAAIGVLSNSGLQASIAGTGLRRVLSELGSPSEDLAAKMGGLTLQGDGLQAVMKQLAVAGVSTAEAMDIFGERGGPAFSVMLRGVDTIEQFTASLQDSEGAAKRFAEGRLGDLDQSFKELRSATEELMLVVGENGLADAFTSVAKSILDFARDDSAITFARNLGQAIEFLVENLDKLVVVLSALAGARIGAIFGPLGAFIGGAAGFLGGLVGNASLAEDATSDLSRTLERSGQIVDAAVVSARDLTGQNLEQVESRLKVAEATKVETDALVAQLEVRLALAQFDLASAVNQDDIAAIEAQQVLGAVADALEAAKVDAEDAGTALDTLRTTFDKLSTATKKTGDALGTTGGTDTLTGGLGKATDELVDFNFTLEGVKDTLHDARTVFDETRTPMEAYNLEVQRLNELFPTLVVMLGDYGEAQEVLNRAIDAAGDKLHKLTDAQKEGLQLTQSLRTPTEVYNDSLTHYRDLLNEGAISQTTFNRAIAEAEQTLASSQGPDIWAETWKNAVEDVQGNLTDTIDDALAGNLDSIDNFADSVVASIRRLAANLLSQQIVIPFVAAGASALGIPLAGIAGAELLGAGGATAGGGLGGALGTIGNGVSSTYSFITGAPASLANTFAMSGVGQSLGLSSAAITASSLSAGTAAGLTGGVAGASGEFFAASLANGAGGLPGLTGAGSALVAAAPYLAVAAAALPILMGAFGGSPSSGPVGVADFSPFSDDPYGRAPRPFSGDNGISDADARASMKGIADAIIEIIQETAERFDAIADETLRLRIANYQGPEGGNADNRVAGFEVNAFVQREAERRIAGGLSEEQAVFEALRFAVQEAFTFENAALTEAAVNTAAASTDELLADLEFAKELSGLREAIRELGGIVDGSTLATARLALELEKQADAFARTAVEPIADAIAKALALFPAVEGTQAVNAEGLAANDNSRLAGSPLNIDTAGRILTPEENGIGGSTFDYGFRFAGEENNAARIGFLNAGDQRFDVERVHSDTNRAGVAFAVSNESGEIIATFETMADALAGAGDALAGYSVSLENSEGQLIRTTEEQARYEANLARVSFQVDIARQSVSDLVGQITGDFEPAIRGPFEEALETGQANLSALEEHLKAVNDEIQTANEAFPELNQSLIDVAQTVADANVALTENLQADYQDSILTQLNEVNGLGAINSINDLIEARDLNRQEAESIGLSTDLADQLFGTQLRSIIDSLDGATRQALLESNQITDTFAADLINGILGGLDGNLAIQDQIDAQLELIDTRRAEASAARSAADIARRNSDTLISAASRLLLDTKLSPLSVEERKNESLRLFDEALVFANDSTPEDEESQRAIRELPGLGRSALDAALSWYGSSTEYNSVAERVRQGLLSTAANQTTIEEQQLAVLRRIEQQLADDNGQLLYVSAGGGQYISTGSGGIPKGLDLGYKPDKALDIYRILTAAGIGFPGAGENQINQLRQRNSRAHTLLTAAGFADGGVFHLGNVIPFARGGVVNRATMFPIGVMGEAGPEAIMPLSRGADGRLGVTVASGGAGPDVHQTHMLIGRLDQLISVMDEVASNTGQTVRQGRNTKKEEAA